MICSKRSSQGLSANKDFKPEGETDASDIISTKKPRTQVSKVADHPTASSSEPMTQVVQTLNKDVTTDALSLALEADESLCDYSILQWGPHKRCRSNRKRRANLSTCRARTSKEHSVIRNNTALASQENTVPRAAATRRRDHSCSPLVDAVEPSEENSKEEKAKRIKSKEPQKRVSVHGVRKEAPPVTQHMHQRECQVQQSSLSNSHERKASSPIGHVSTNLTGGLDASATGKDFVFPKFVIQLSRKEKAEDFLMFKGCRLPLRPKRRPRAVEKALLYSTPGNWLSEMSYSRYFVTEKRSLKEKAAGLKAMESMDSDSE
ncbi:hypothetical protein KP509_22G058400 [Ceratopteris richardii]|nr:hypothetical protein KP509_22G058400 [Ceratopteris richardii]